MPSTRKWPPELSKPLILEEIDKEISPHQRNKYFETERLIAIDTDFRWRAEVMADFLRDLFRNDDYPLNPFGGADDEWLCLLVRVCKYWKIPGFHVEMVKPRGPGASKFWTDQKLCELFSDIQAVVKNEEISEHSAAQLIAKHPDDFGNRYVRPGKARSRGAHSTIYRQFNAAKKQIRFNSAFRAAYFADKKYGPDLTEWAINRYSFSQVTRRSKRSDF